MVALLYVLLSTAPWAGRHFSIQVRAQSAFAAHVAAGLALVPALGIALLTHPLRMPPQSAARLWLGSAVGLVVCATGALTVAFGLRRIGFGGFSRWGSVARYHGELGWIFCGLTAAHILTSWRFRQGIGRARQRLAPIPLLLCWTLLGLAILALSSTPTPASLKPIPPGYREVGFGDRTPFTPGRIRTSHGKFIPTDLLCHSQSCGASGCHEQITREWSSSMHRHAASNDHYRAQVKLRMHDLKGKKVGARFCSACHEPIAALAGELDDTGRGIDFPENLAEGISCVSCHRMTGLVSTAGNGSYVAAPAEPYLLQGKPGVAGAFAGYAIRAHPEPHRESLMRPFLRESHACLPCHQLTVGPGINPNGFFQVQETYDEYVHTRYADSKAKWFARCQDCHMPLVPSTDPAAKGGKHRSHRFPGANTMRPFLDGDVEQLDVIQKFLQSGVVSLTLSVEEPWIAGKENRLQVLVKNERVGHRFPTGTVDMHDIWIELIVEESDGHPLLISGQIDPKTGMVDARAECFKTTPLGRDGQWLYRRDMWNLNSFKMGINPVGETIVGQTGFSTLGPRTDYFNISSLGFFRSVWPDMTDERPYRVAVPAGPERFLQIRARLRYRKSNQRFTDWVFNPAPPREGSGYQGPHRMGTRLPITDMAAATVRVKVQAR